MTSQLYYKTATSFIKNTAETAADVIVRFKRVLPVLIPSEDVALEIPRSGLKVDLRVKVDDKVYSKVQQPINLKLLQQETAESHAVSLKALLIVWIGIMNAI